MATPPAYPYGYKLSHIGKKAVDEEKAEVVRLIYKKYIEGLNRYALTWYLINRKILRPRGDSCNWQYSMVARILEDERYLGTVNFPQILSTDVFEMAQQKRNDEKENAVSKRHESCNENRSYPFSGFIQCESCGSYYIRGIQHYNRFVRKASWRCRDKYRKIERTCMARGNIYEEVLEVVCVHAYNQALKNFAKGYVQLETKVSKVCRDPTLEILIREIIRQMKGADEKAFSELEETLHVLTVKKTAADWREARLDLSDFETEKIKQHFAANPEPMTVFEERMFKTVFMKILAGKPGELKFILRNGMEIPQEYKPLRGQTGNAKKCGSDTRQADQGPART